jgi:hypothetical protein
MHCRVSSMLPKLTTTMLSIPQSSDTARSIVSYRSCQSFAFANATLDSRSAGSSSLSASSTAARNSSWSAAT